MDGNGFGWGQLSHTFAWVFKVTGLTPKKVYAVNTNSDHTGADIYNSITVTCTNGATISCTGVGVIPDHGFKVVGNWLFGTEGMLSYNALAANTNSEGLLGEHEVSSKPKLEIWRHDGTTETGPSVEFENLDTEGTGPGSIDALVAACQGLPFYLGAGADEGLKTVATIDAMYKSGLSGLPENVVLK